MTLYKRIYSCLFFCDLLLLFKTSHLGIENSIYFKICQAGLSCIIISSSPCSMLMLINSPKLLCKKTNNNNRCVKKRKKPSVTLMTQQESENLAADLWNTGWQRERRAWAPRQTPCPLDLLTREKFRLLQWENRSSQKRNLHPPVTQKSALWLLKASFSPIFPITFRYAS